MFMLSFKDMLSGFLVTTAWRVLGLRFGAEGRHIRKIVATILNKQLRAAEKGWSSSLGLTILTVKIILL